MSQIAPFHNRNFPGTFIGTLICLFKTFPFWLEEQWHNRSLETFLVGAKKVFKFNSQLWSKVPNGPGTAELNTEQRSTQWFCCFLTCKIVSDKHDFLCSALQMLWKRAKGILSSWFCLERGPKQPKLCWIWSICDQNACINYSPDLEGEGFPAVCISVFVYVHEPFRSSRSDVKRIFPLWQASIWGLDLKVVYSSRPPICSPNPTPSPGTGSYKTVNFIKIHLFSLYQSHYCHLCVLPPHTPFWFFSFFFFFDNSICFLCVVLLSFYQLRPSVLLLFFLLCQVWRS